MVTSLKKKETLSTPMSSPSHLGHFRLLNISLFYIFQSAIAFTYFSSVLSLWLPQWYLLYFLKPFSHRGIMLWTKHLRLISWKDEVVLFRFFFRSISKNTRVCSICLRQNMVLLIFISTSPNMPCALTASTETQYDHKMGRSII